MGLLRVLSGQSKLRMPNRERFLAISKSAESLRRQADIRATEKAGIAFNPVESAFFNSLDSELRKLLGSSGRATGTRFEIVDDGFGSRWVVLDDRDFEDLVSTIHQVSNAIYEHGFAQRLLAAVFKFQYERRDAYWVYNFKRGSFYPVIPSGDKQRDNAAEMRLGKVMAEAKIPVERALEQWYSLWGIPF